MTPAGAKICAPRGQETSFCRKAGNTADREERPTVCRLRKLPAPKKNDGRLSAERRPSPPSDAEAAASDDDWLTSLLDDDMTDIPEIAAGDCNSAIIKTDGTL